jgi:hypothetical protein
VEHPIADMNGSTERCGKRAREIFIPTSHLVVLKKRVDIGKKKDGGALP